MGVTVVRPGAAKAAPFTIAIVANPALERGLNSNTFAPDPIMQDPGAFQACARYIETALFGGLPGQAEPMLGDPAIAPHVRLVTVFASNLGVSAATSLVAEDGYGDGALLIARRRIFDPLLVPLGVVADVAFAVSRSVTHRRASAWYTTDDDTKPGVPFQLDGVTLYHRFARLIPGTVAIHYTAASLTALHEFQHAISSYSNGSITDLYVDSDPAVNNKHGRPIPAQFGRYAGAAYRSDPARDSLGYPPNWRSYHAELVMPARPAIMDDYWEGKPHPVNCENDAITRRFILDRIHAKLRR